MRPTSPTNHPPFKLTLWQGAGSHDVMRVSQTDKAHLVERSHLKFPHDLHLKTSVRGPKGRKTLECRSCHVPDASGKGFEPIVDEQRRASSATRSNSNPR